jgi:hypothetical protein
MCALLLSLPMYNKLKFGIYRKPMTSDLLVHNASSHPYEHAKASIIYLINRMTQYPLTHAKRNEENEIIKEILTIISIHNKTYIRNKSLPEKMPNKRKKE